MKRRVKQRRERSEVPDRYAHRVRQFQRSCDSCSCVLRRTHDYVQYGNLCWFCWRYNQRCSVVVASQEVAYEYDA